jgi:predicted glycoside hydrolase/deacetylase ChbG (UPF0249 family)
MTFRLIVNADDYGRTEGVCEGIRVAHLNGIVTSTSAMMNLPGVEDELRRARQRVPGLGLGVHLVLTSGRPLLPPGKVKSLIDATGNFLRPEAFVERLTRLDPGEVRAEWRAQIEKFRKTTGRDPTHLDSHHHASYFSEILFAVMLELADDYGIPVRRPISGSSGEGFPPELAASVQEFVPRLAAEYQAVMPDRFVSSFYGQGATKENLLAILETLEAGTTEIMTHPGYCTDELLRVTTYAVPREAELQILTAPEVMSLVRNRRIELMTFADL